jgi:hypothetical protein
VLGVPTVGSWLDEPAHNEHLRQCWYNQSIGVDGTTRIRNTVWIGNLATASTSNGGGLDAAHLVAVQPVPALPYAHADHHVL